MHDSAHTAHGMTRVATVTDAEAHLHEQVEHVPFGRQSAALIIGACQVCRVCQVCLVFKVCGCLPDVQSSPQGQLARHRCNASGCIERRCNASGCRWLSIRSTTGRIAPNACPAPSGTADERRPHGVTQAVRRDSGVPVRVAHGTSACQLELRVADGTHGRVRAQVSTARPTRPSRPRRRIPSRSRTRAPLLGTRRTCHGSQRVTALPRPDACNLPRLGPFTPLTQKSAYTESARFAAPRLTARA